MYNMAYERMSLTVGSDSFDIDECQIGIDISASSQKKIPFFIEHPNGTIPYELELTNTVTEKYVIRCTGNDCQFVIGRNTVTGTELFKTTDAYEICGQAQKSVKWAGSKGALVDHLRKREKNRLKAGRNSRFETGAMAELNTFLALAKQKKIRFEVILAHPGISYAGLSSNSDQARNMLRLLAATASYLAETYEMKMSLVINQ